VQAWAGRLKFNSLEDPQAWPSQHLILPFHQTLLENERYKHLLRLVIRLTFLFQREQLATSTDTNDTQHSSKPIPPSREGIGRDDADRLAGPFSAESIAHLSSFYAQVSADWWNCSSWLWWWWQWYTTGHGHGSPGPTQAHPTTVPMPPELKFSLGSNYISPERPEEESTVPPAKRRRLTDQVHALQTSTEANPTTTAQTSTTDTDQEGEEEGAEYQWVLSDEVIAMFAQSEIRKRQSTPNTLLETLLMPVWPPTGVGEEQREEERRRRDEEYRRAEEEEARNPDPLKLSAQLPPPSLATPNGPPLTYGPHTSRITALEAALNAKFDAAITSKRPVLWPTLPFARWRERWLRNLNVWIPQKIFSPYMTTAPPQSSQRDVDEGWISIPQKARPEKPIRRAKTNKKRKTPRTNRINNFRLKQP